MRFLVLVLLSVLLPMKAMADEKHWQWISMNSGVDTWYVTKGEGSITFNGKKFDAKLYDSRDKSLAFTITGEINANQVKAYVTTLDSDVARRHMVGTYHKATWKNFSTAGRETILIGDTASTFGLTRETDK